MSKIPFLPPLSADELSLLRSSINSEAGEILLQGSREAKLAQSLADREMLERHDDPRLVRATAKGSDAAKPLTPAGARLYAQWALDAVEEGDCEAASSRERALLRRVLAEAMLLTDQEIVRKLARVALTLSEYDFPRWG